MAKKVAEDNEKFQQHHQFIIIQRKEKHWWQRSIQQLFLFCLERMKNHAFKLDALLMLITGEKSSKNQQIQN